VTILRSGINIDMRSYFPGSLKRKVRIIYVCKKEIGVQEKLDIRLRKFENREGLMWSKMISH